MISFDPTDDERALREEVRKFAEAELRKQGRECEKAGGAPAALRRTYHELGLTTLDWPESLGGAGLSTVARAIVEEELAWGDGGLALALDGPGLAGIALRELGSEAQKRRWLAPFAEPAGATRVGALAISEADLGADLGHVATRAERESRGYLLTGRKLYVLRADEADFFVVLAKAPSDDPKAPVVRAFVIERGAPGVTVGKPDERLGLQAVRSAPVDFDGARVEADALLFPDRGDWAGAFDRFLARMWITTAARAVGIARAALEYACFYAQDRTAFGKKIGQFQGIAFKIADMAMDVDAARWLTWRAAWTLDRAASNADLGTDALRRAALAAVHANDAAVRAGIDCVQVLGGAGYMEDYPAEKWMREARALAQIGGNDPLRNHIAGEREYGALGETGPAVDPWQAFAAFGQAFA